MSASEITEVRHLVDRSGSDQCAIRYADGTSQTHAGLAWAEARAVAEHAGLNHRDDEPGGTTWSRLP